MNAPKHLTGLAKAEWLRITKENDFLPCDRDAVAAYCSVYATCVEADEALKQDGLIVEMKGGQKVPNPYLVVRNKAMSLLLRFSVQLKLTPKSRGVEKQDEDDSDLAPPGLE